MRKAMILVVLAFAAASAQAQIKCWTDANGKRTCGDTPPPGAKTTTIRGTTASPAAPAPAAKGAAAKDAKKGPLTPAEQEQEYRKRQAEAEKEAKKIEQELQQAAAKKENCENARQNLALMESGQRIGRTDSKGERYYLEQAQIAQETAKARQLVQQACN